MILRDGFKKFLAVFLVVIFVGYMLFSGIGDLINKKDVYTVNINECVEALSIEHSITGLIPVGTDHYYLGVDDETGQGCFIKASKSWYSKNFDANGAAIEPGGLNITSLAKKPDSFEVEKELVSRAEQIASVEFSVPPSYSLDLAYKFNAICKLVMLVLAILLVLGFLWMSRTDKEIKGWIKKGYFVVCIIFLVLLLRVLI